MEKEKINDTMKKQDIVTIAAIFAIIIFVVIYLIVASNEKEKTNVLKFNITDCIRSTDTLILEKRDFIIVQSLSEANAIIRDKKKIKLSEDNVNEICKKEVK